MDLLTTPTKTPQIQPFTIQLKIHSISELISHCVNAKPSLLGRDSKDSHINSINNQHIIVSFHKNANICDFDSGKLVKEINLKGREMSSSLVFKDILLVGTYVDTLFAFSISNNYEPLFSIRAHDSILSLCVLSESENVVALGQSGGYLDIIQIQNNIATPLTSFRSSKIGYINKVSLA